MRAVPQYLCAPRSSGLLSAVTAKAVNGKRISWERAEGDEPRVKWVIEGPLGPLCELSTLITLAVCRVHAIEEHLFEEGD